MTRRSIFCLIASLALAAGAPAARAQVCDEYAGDPAEGTPEWTQRDADNVSCGNQKASDADASPAFQAKYDEQVAIEQVEFATVTAPEWAAEPNRPHAGAGAVPPS